MWYFYLARGKVKIDKFNEIYTESVLVPQYELSSEITFPKLRAKFQR